MFQMELLLLGFDWGLLGEFGGFSCLEVVDDGEFGFFETLL